MSRFVKICQLQSILHSVIDKQVQRHHRFDILMLRAGISTMRLGPRTLLFKTLSNLFLLTDHAPITDRLKTLSNIFWWRITRWRSRVCQQGAFDLGRSLALCKNLHFSLNKSTWVYFTFIQFNVYLCFIFLIFKRSGLPFKKDRENYSLWFLPFCPFALMPSSPQALALAPAMALSFI